MKNIHFFKIEKNIPYFYLYKMDCYALGYVTSDGTILYVYDYGFGLREIESNISNFNLILDNYDKEDIITVKSKEEYFDYQRFKDENTMCRILFHDGSATVRFKGWDGELVYKKA